MPPLEYLTGGTHIGCLFLRDERCGACDFSMGLAVLRVSSLFTHLNLIVPGFCDTRKS
jgi:hypothetical protein